MKWRCRECNGRENKGYEPKAAVDAWPAPIACSSCKGKGTVPLTVLCVQLNVPIKKLREIRDYQGEDAVHRLERA